MKAIVTGAASGIGRAVAERLAANPWNGRAQLVLVGRNADKLELAAAALRESGAEAVTEVADLADPAVPERVVRRAHAEFGGLDAIASNAGMLKVTPLAELSVEDYEHVFAVNTRSTWLLGKAAYPLLKASRGCIVATASLASEHPTPPLGTYSASKAALVMLMKQMAVEWGPDGIRCNCVSPGATLTPMTANIYDDPAQRAQRERNIALGRIGTPQDVANVIVFLLGPGSGFVTGTNVLVDGGSHLMLMPAMGAGAAHQEGSRQVQR
jgi:NAD(P)-dependent dehydrogenase (short-subunit alcohol dehydrogenase family)